jgi:uncharacterized membrane protein YjjP (DUF1212 family)
MDYSAYLDLATDVGYALAMHGAETFRIEESVTRILKAYGIESEVFAIPNCLHVCIHPAPGQTMVRMKRIGDHGNDLDSVELFSGLSRRICGEKPSPEEAARWLEETRRKQRRYRLPVYLLAHFLAGFGFNFLFGGNFVDGLCSGLCGLTVGLVNKLTQSLGANLFFRTLAASFPMALLAYALQALGLTQNPDAVTIGALMLLVPGLLITNAMRDIIYGDTNSGINRLVQVLLIAAAIVLGTATAWKCAAFLWGAPSSTAAIDYAIWQHWLPCAIGCIGFAILFNIHGPGMLLCILGGVISWSIYLLVYRHTGNDFYGYFFSTLFAAGYAEVMARIRKYPAISYLVVSIFPMIPGAGVYYTMRHAVEGDMALFASTGMHTAAIAGILAVGILLASTTVRLLSVWRHKRKSLRP